MSHEHYPHLFSHEWLELHPELVTVIKRYGGFFCLGVLVAISAYMVTNLKLELKVPLGMAMAAVEPTVHPAYTDYLPEQFFQQEKQAPIQELPPQF